MVGTRITPRPNGGDDDDDDDDEAENRSISELVLALRTASQAEDFSRVEEALAAREAKLKREIEEQRRENAVLEEKHEFERLEKLKAEAELKQSTVKAEAVSAETLPAEAKEYDEGKEIILRVEKGRKKLRKGSSGNMERRRSERLASIENVDANNNLSVSSAPPVDGNGGLQISGYRRVLKKQMERKNMEKKKVGRKKLGRKKTAANKWGRGEDYVQYRCNMLSFFNTMQKIKKHLTEDHLELLKKTPFWPLIFAFYYGLISEDQCKKSESDVRKIIKCYNSRTMMFEFGSTSAPLTTEDVVEILGLPQEGEELKLKGSRKYSSDFTKRHFEVERVIKTRVDDALEEAIKGKRQTDLEDVVRLIVIELCLTFLLCSSGHVTSWNLVKYCEDLENISRYSWAKAVADLLHKSLKKKTMRLKQNSVAGCVVVIMIWLCEKTNLVQPIRGREGHTPAIVKWNMRELHLKLRHMDIANIRLSFEEDKEKKERKRKEEENEETHEEAEIVGQLGGVADVENMFDDTVGSLADEIRGPMTQTKFRPTPTILTRLDNGNEVLEKRSEDLWEMVQNASAEVAKAQGKVNRLTEKLERKKAKTKKLKRKLKEEKKEKRKVEEDNEIVIAEKKSLFGSMKSLVQKIEGTLEAEREEVKNLNKEKMELIKEIQELKDQLNRDAIRLREDMPIETSPNQSNLARLENSIIKRASDPEFDHEQGGKKKRKVEEEKEKEEQEEDVHSGAIPAGI